MSSPDYLDPDDHPPYTVEDLVHLGNEVLQTLSGVRSVRMIRGCCTQGCCASEVLDVLYRRPPESSSG